VKQATLLKFEPRPERKAQPFPAARRPAAVWLTRFAAAAVVILAAVGTRSPVSLDPAQSWLLSVKGAKLPLKMEAGTIAIK